MEDKLKSVAFIPVRLSSSRLPEKHLKPIGGKPLLSWVISRLRDCGEIDDIVICAPCDRQSGKLKSFAESEGVTLFVYSGDIDDVVGRLTAAAIKYDAGLCVLASGDCPLIAPATVDAMVRLLKRNLTLGNVQFAEINGSLPIHEGLIVSRRWVWERAQKYSDTPELREHQFPVYLRNVYPEKFEDLKTFWFEDEAIYYEVRHRISVDTPDDLKFMNCSFDALKSRGKDFNLQNVISLLAEDPGMRAINGQVYQKNYGEKSYKALFCVSSGTGRADGCDSLPGSVSEPLSDSVDLGTALVNLFGIGVRFACLDEETGAYVQSKGFSVSQVKSFDDVPSVHSLYSYDVAIFEPLPGISRVIEKVKAAYGVKTVLLDSPFSHGPSGHGLTPTAFERVDLHVSPDRENGEAGVAKKIAELLK
ncbi:MAG: NTP transferase domain-containing protein [Nitrospirae bacterium]|nr:NTP transferase domain-containing protein [Nitrospirota bacterium]